MHRLGGTPADLEFMADGLCAGGFTVSCPLLYGHGGSRELLGATTWTAWYGSVAQALEQLRDRCDTVIAGGIGVGALLALHLAAADQERVKGLVLYAPTLWPDGWAMPWYGNVLRALGHKGLANLIRFDERPPYGIKDDALRQAMLERRARDGRSHQDVFGRIGGAFIELKRMADVVVPELPYIGQPSLIFHPREDDRSHMKASQLLQERLGGIVDLVVLEDSYHLVTLDRQRDVVLDKSIGFAIDLPRSSSGASSPTCSRGRRGREGRP